MRWKGWKTDRTPEFRNWKMFKRISFRFNFKIKGTRMQHGPHLRRRSFYILTRQDHDLIMSFNITPYHHISFFKCIHLILRQMYLEIHFELGTKLKSPRSRGILCWKSQYLVGMFSIKVEIQLFSNFVEIFPTWNETFQLQNFQRRGC